MATRYGAKFHLTFRAWLYQQRHLPGELGNLARLLMADSCLWVEAPKQLRNILSHRAARHHDTHEQRALLESLWAIYQSAVVPRREQNRKG